MSLRSHSIYEVSFKYIDQIRDDDGRPVRDGGELTQVYRVVAPSKEYVETWFNTQYRAFYKAQIPTIKNLGSLDAYIENHSY